MGTTATRVDAVGLTTRIERRRRSPRIAALFPLLGLGILGAECDPDDDDADDDATGICEEYGDSPYTAHPSWYVWPDLAPESIPVEGPNPDREHIYYQYYLTRHWWWPASSEAREGLACWYQWRMEVRSKWQAEANGKALPSLPYDAGEPLAQLHEATFEALTATEETEGCAALAEDFDSVLNDLGRVSILIAPTYDPSVPNADGTTAGDRTTAIAGDLGLEPAFGAWWWDEESGADPVPMGTFFAEPGTWNPDFSLAEPGNATGEPTQYFSLYSWLDASGKLIPNDACPFGCPTDTASAPCDPVPGVWEDPPGDDDSAGDDDATGDDDSDSPCVDCEWPRDTVTVLMEGNLPAEAGGEFSAELTLEGYGDPFNDDWLCKHWYRSVFSPTIGDVYFEICLRQPLPDGTSYTGEPGDPNVDLWIIVEGSDRFELDQFGIDLTESCSGDSPSGTCHCMFGSSTLGTFTDPEDPTAWFTIQGTLPLDGCARYPN